MNEAREGPLKRSWRWVRGGRRGRDRGGPLRVSRAVAGARYARRSAVRKDLVVTITSDGTLEPPPGGELRAPASASVAAILVAEGQRVDPRHGARAARRARSSRSPR